MNEEKKKGRFIVLEGVDAVGKTKTTKLLAEKMGASIFKSPSEPYASLTHLVNDDKSPLVRYLFYTLATENDNLKIKEMLDNGQDIICDRYFYSTYAYHKTMGLDIELDTTHILIPDFAFLLTAPKEVRQQRLEKRKQKDLNYSIRPLEEKTEFQEMVQDCFRTLVLEEIDTELNSCEEVVEIIHQKISSGLVIA
jgi:dTMP kinase